MATIQNFWEQDHPGKEVFAFSENKDIPFSRFQDLVGSIVALLNKKPPGRWVLWSSNSFNLTAALFALWQQGSQAILPPNAQLKTLQGALKDSLGLITDQKDLSLSGVWPDTDGEVETRLSLKEISLQDTAVILFTSGTTGNASEINKSFGQLEEELISLEENFGSFVDGTKFLSTVGGNHFYGLLFRILWPVLQFRPFDCHNLLYPSDIAHALKQHNPSTLITGPALISRLNEITEEQPLQNPKCTFSSGGPLKESDSQLWLNRSDHRPFEILGSTETGGIAQKSFEGDEPVWKAFAKVKTMIGPGSRLLIQSAFLDNKEFLTNDTVDILKPGVFKLLGRSDRIVKIEEKRIDLSIMEDLLKDHPQVREVMVFETSRIMDDKKQNKLAAAIVPMDLNDLNPNKRQILIQTLKNWMNQYFDSPSLPKYWRFVAELPRTTAGKPDFTQGTRLFEDNPAK